MKNVEIRITEKKRSRTGLVARMLFPKIGVKTKSPLPGGSNPGCDICSIVDKIYLLVGT
jgi:hypothetical protein